MRGPREKSPKFPQFHVWPPGDELKMGCKCFRAFVGPRSELRRHGWARFGRVILPFPTVPCSSTFLSKVRKKKTLASGRPKFSLTVPHRDTLAVLILSTLCPRFAIPLGGLREGCEWDTGSWVGSFRSYRSVLRDRAVKANLGQGRAQKAFHEADPRICRSGRRLQKQSSVVQYHF
ncbi:hypothetical protein XENOCAPTIV_007855 [Xenoophorus captivus]|uniref:Uncharacterized protein n=1 Tax=Xenoophorus captivus TaxID=1517983 RepID=A0ABV0R8T7_9TELE